MLRAVTMSHITATESDRETGAESLVLEAGVRAKLCSVVGDGVTIVVLVENWREIRPRFSENEATMVEAAIRQIWRRP